MAVHVAPHTLGSSHDSAYRLFFPSVHPTAAPGASHIQCVNKWEIPSHPFMFNTVPRTLTLSLIDLRRSVSITNFIWKSKELCWTRKTCSTACSMTFWYFGQAIYRDTLYIPWPTCSPSSAFNKVPQPQHAAYSLVTPVTPRQIFSTRLGHFTNSQCWIAVPPACHCFITAAGTSFLSLISASTVTIIPFNQLPKLVSAMWVHREGWCHCYKGGRVSSTAVTTYRRICGN